MLVRRYTSIGIGILFNQMSDHKCYSAENNEIIIIIRANGSGEPETKMVQPKDDHNFISRRIVFMNGIITFAIEHNKFIGQSTTTSRWIRI